ncbi:YczE/YyaS/YitT family protein [Halobacillus seohaensis]|uniref:YitT family protein n=1 Tax=Halobacillus seohaensis TaxID=447421 RepID=A0ABW2EMP1_9BACI
MFVGISDKLGLTVGMWYAIFQPFFIFVNGWLMKQKPEIKALLPLVLESLILDFWVEIVFSTMSLASAPFIVQLMALFFGITFSALGVSIYILPQLPRAPVDQLFLVIAEKLNISLRLSQTAVALTTSSSALLIGGPVGLGTVLGVAFAGTLIQYFYTIGFPIYYLYHPLYRQRFQPLL